MNTYTISLSSNSSSYESTLECLEFDDYTKLSISIDNVDESVLPIFLKIDWGDGSQEIFDNDIYKTGRNSNTNLYYSPMLSPLYTHEYYPSPTTLYRSLTAQVLLEYSNGDHNWFIIPIKIRTFDYFESINDLELINTNILPTEDNPKEHQFITNAGGFLVELVK